MTISEHGNIVEQDDHDQTTNIESNKIISKDLNEKQLKFCSSLLTRIRKNASSGPFLKPVDPDAYGIPDYFDKIKHPMDISTMRLKLDSKKYANATEFKADFDLMIGNCILYNGESSPVGIMGRTLESAFNKIYASEMPVEIPESKKRVPLASDDESTRKKLKRFDYKSTEWDNCNNLLNELEKQKHRKVTWPFLQPVNPQDVPNYYEVISNPMDLSKIRQKFTDSQYSTFDELESDLELIVSNCKKFNAENTEIYNLGVEFEKLFKTYKTGGDNEITEIRKKISDLTARLTVLETNKRNASKSRIFSIAEREEMGTKILQLKKSESDTVVEIIQRNCSNFTYVGNDEIEINMHTLPDYVLAEIREFLDKLENKAESSSEFE